ncbi:SCP-2 sterol transfer family protein [Albimonas donghaensis]|uniref:SCP-2 sterol transfer family protein n=1 Tax=Albimonas donghaensis TaxID=356660 RepID=A0A1H3A8K1_9RHOB|nr:SCP2 sterol-binding domain-containing protein [Albimonas donghaensis]MAS43037.1 sterol carrier family protein [Paracoccaceae bacterium]MBR29138.1 sterol carrier family protein [Paracoccaceae bacterium]SDX25966.1 SCP-2 sterol transfer family protein [Albimonas donghaensis]
MSETLNEAAELLRERLDGNSVNGSVKFDVEGLGALRIDDDVVSVDEGGEADCTISADEETFRGLVSGETSPTSAFMTGKLRVDGDMSKAMALASVLS